MTHEILSNFAKPSEPISELFCLNPLFR